VPIKNWPPGNNFMPSMLLVALLAIAGDVCIGVGAQLSAERGAAGMQHA
jgi:hypothetical protein